MKTGKYHMYYILIILLLSSAKLYGEWEWLNPKPQGNTIIGMKFINECTGFAVGGAGTVLKTTDCGTSWSKLVINTTVELHGISIIGQNIIYAGGENNIVKTTDGGQTWQVYQINVNGDIFSTFFLNENTGWAGTDNQVIKTTNAGLNWTAFNTVTTGWGGSINSMYFFNKDTGLAAGASYRIQRTTNGGINWSIIYQEFPASGAFLSMIFVNDSTGYVVGSQGKIRKTVNSGLNWSPLVSGTNNELHCISSLDINNLIISGSNGSILKSTNAGNAWVPLNPERNFDLWAIDYLSANSIYTGGESGYLLKSTNAGNNWNELSSGFYTDIYEIKFLNSLTGFAMGGGALLKTTNSGINWNTTGQGGKALFFIDALTGYTGGYGGMVSKTTDSGLNWTSSGTGLTSDIYNLYFINSLTGYAGGEGKISFTTDGGSTWSIQNLSYSGIVRKIQFINSTTGLVSNATGKILRTTNAGELWTLVFSGNSSIKGLDIADQNTCYATYSMHILKSTNSGIDWFELPDITNFNGQLLDFIDANTGYVTGLINPWSSSVVMFCKTTNGGINWTSEFPGLHLNTLSLFALNSDTCFISGFGGAILRRTSAPIGIKPVTDKIPTKYILYQNYPNPFNPTTTIKFSIPSSKNEYMQPVKITIYDILGREIATIINEQFKPGVYEVNFDSGSYTSGIYYYKLTAGNYTETKKMVLVK
jgi:photosystem II stability/assembly factor-like uncharacterized protein